MFTKKRLWPGRLRGLSAAVLFGCFLLLGLTGCRPPQGMAVNGGQEMRTITDMAGRTVTVPAQIKKVYATSPVGTILVYTVDPGCLGAWNYLMPVGESQYILPEYRKLPVIGGWLGGKNFGNVEEIIKLKPDVILHTRLPGRDEKELADVIQQRTNTPVVVVDSLLTELDKAYEFTGRLLGREERGAALAAYCRETLGDIEKQRSRIAKPLRVYYAEGMKGLETEPRGSMHTSVIELLADNVAGTDLAAGGPVGRSQVSLEQVLAWEPDMLLVAYFPEGESSSYESILNEPKWQNLRAVRERQVYEVPARPFNWIDRPPSVNRLIGVKWLANLFYPEVYPYDMPAELKRFYQLFYHCQISDADAAELLKRSVR